MAHASRSRMFVRIMMRAALVHRGRTVAALLAVSVAAAVATAMLNIYVDTQAKLQHEFRSYGANLVIVGKNGAALPADTLAKVDGVLAGKGVAVPFAYAVATIASGKPVVVAGTDFARARELNRWWSVSQWPGAPQEALVGSRAKSAVSPTGNAFDLSYGSKTAHLITAGTLNTGGEEDSRIYLSLTDFTTWTGLAVSTIEVGAAGSTAEIENVRQRLTAELPSAEVKPVRQIMEGEQRVLGKARASLLASAVVIIVTSILCVVATLTAWVLEQRKNFAIMKALGASERIVTGFFAAEVSALGAIGALLGMVIGLGVAAWIARANFHAAVTPRLSVLPIVFFGSIGLALLAAVVPMSLLRRVQPATILRGE